MQSILSFSSRLLFAAVLAVCLPMPSSAQADSQPFSINPTSARQNVAFDLHLRSLRYNCGTTYSHQSVDVLPGSGGGQGKITLSFLPTNHPEAICPAVVMPYGPTFTISPLVPGSYEVYARVVTPCMVASGNHCLMEVVPEFAGTLTVGRSVAWFMTPTQAPPEKPFTLQLLSESYGNGHTSFIDEKLELRNGKLYASFMVVHHPERTCIADIHPHGPSFNAEGYPVGKYPVYALASTDVTAKPPAQQFVDTLSVFKGADPTSIGTGNGNGSRVILPETPAMPGTIQGYRPDGRKPVPGVIK